MSNGLIKGRGGQHIRVEEYPPGHVEDLNARLNAIAAEPDDSLEDRVLDAVLGNGLKVATVAAGVFFVVVVSAQVGRWLGWA